MKLYHKLMSGFIPIILLCVLIGGIVVYRIKSIAEITEQEVLRSLYFQGKIWEIMDSLEHMEIAINNYLFLGGGLKERRFDYFYEKEHLNKLIQEYQKEACPHATPFLKKYNEYIQTFYSKIEIVFELHREGIAPKIIEEQGKDCLKYLDIIHEDALKPLIAHVQKDHIEPARKNIAKIIHNTLLLVTMILIIVIMLSIAISLVISYSITIPVKKLTSAAVALSETIDLTQRVEVKSKDEIGQLGISFNKMVDRLKESYDKIAAYSQDLEKKVKERTKELTRNQTEMLHMIEDLNRHSKELKDAQDKIIRSEKLAVIGQLASSIAHELRNPLGVMKNALYYLNMLEVGKDNADIKENLDILAIEIDNADKIINNLLEFARIKKPILQQENINIIINEVLHKLKIPGNITVALELNAGLPKIEVDALQIHQVFYNIVTNALQGMDKGGRLTIKTTLKDNFLEASFSDTGDGIPKENLNKIFEPLFSTKAKGTGLGLSICLSLVQGHKGKIEVESKINKGSTFTVKLPVS